VVISLRMVWSGYGKVTMKALNILLLSIVFICPCIAGDIPWTYSVRDDEDGSSSHYYFFLSSGSRITRVRWVWNGGAQNPPTVRDYLVEPGTITVRYLAGKRESVRALTSGREAELEVKNEYTVATSNIGIPPAALTDGQRRDLDTLISLLAMERKPKQVSAR